MLDGAAVLFNQGVAVRARARARQFGHYSFFSVIGRVDQRELLEIATLRAAPQIYWAARRCETFDYLELAVNRWLTAARRPTKTVP